MAESVHTPPIQRGERVERVETPAAEAPEEKPGQVISGERAERRLTALGPFFKGLLKPLASLRLTVWLFALSIFLIFAGTLVQVDRGIWRVMDEYFRAGITYIELNIFFPDPVWADIEGGLNRLASPVLAEGAQIDWGFYYPGGWLLGTLILVNLLAAHAVRFKLSWKRSGMFLIHAGLIVMLLSEFVTGLYAVEGNMTIEEGEASNFIEHSLEYELAVIDPSDPEVDEVTAVPESLLLSGGVVRHEALPFDIELERYMVNSDLVLAHTAPADLQPFAFTTRNQSVVAIEKPEVSGTDPQQTVDAAAAIVTFRDKQTGDEIDTRMLSLWRYRLDRPEVVTVGETDYHVYLRFARTYKPYTMHLHDFSHDQYIGTSIAKNFSSHIRLIHPENDVDRDVLIYMNHPLRYEGETFFQSSFLPGNTGTILQVVRNPGWLMPYISCIMVAAGLLIHFGISLRAFLRKRAAQ